MRGKHEQQRRPRSRVRRRRHPIGTVIAIVAAAVALIVLGTRATSQGENYAPPPIPQPAPLVSEARQPDPDTTPPPSPAPITTPEPEPPAACRFPLAPEERDLTERVVMAEAGGECYEGQMAVAQCILNACEKTGGKPSEVILAYQYAKPADTATQSVRDAVAAVFDAGETVTTEPIMFFYAPRWTDSEWHETQRFVMEIGGHRFFAEKGANQ